MKISKRVSSCFFLLSLSLLPSAAAQTASSSSPHKLRAPKIWDEKALATWATPITPINVAPHFYSAKEYYAAPIANLRTYPVYLPDREPKDYGEWLKKQGAQPLIEPEKLKTEAEWILAGRRVFDELDVPLVRTANANLIKYLRDGEALRKDGVKFTKEGAIAGARWVVEEDGALKLGLSDCSGCHLRVMDDGSVIRGAQGNLPFPSGFAPFFEGFALALGENGKPVSPGELSYMAFGVPWLPDDVHKKFKTMTPEEFFAIFASSVPGTISRFNGSPFYMTKIPDLIGVKDRRYLDHTGTHLNRGPEDIARYGILVSTADDGSIGPYTFLNEKQRRLRYRFPDEAMYALGLFIYSLEPPPNPNRFDDLASQGQKVFARTGCATCHTPPGYTNNMLMPVDDFAPPQNDPATKRLHILEGIRLGTDPNLALKTRKGTGYYKVPSLKGLWYRGLIEHSGSIASLEEWLDRKRLQDDYVPSGWKGPGVKSRAVKGHEFGLDLSAEDKRALIAFLKTL